MFCDYAGGRPIDITNIDEILNFVSNPQGHLDTPQSISRQPQQLLQHQQQLSNPQMGGNNISTRSPGFPWPTDSSNPLAALQSLEVKAGNVQNNLASSAGLGGLSNFSGIGNMGLGDPIGGSGMSNVASGALKFLLVCTL